jgi:predicted ABC-type transport system involved in lysophospholipase L1 biosynthesis ATPase subunit
VPGLPNQLVGFVAERLGVAPAHAEDPTVFADEPDPLSIL